MAEIKKGKYIYYHCTGHADGNRGSPAGWRRGEISAVYRQPFDLLAETLAIAAAERGAAIARGHPVSIFP